MTITGMEQFQSICRNRLVEWYHKNKACVEILYEDTFVVWACKTLQNYKCLVSTRLNGEHVYAEYSFNGDKNELYEDVYGKMTNFCYTE